VRIAASHGIVLKEGYYWGKMKEKVRMFGSRSAIDKYIMSCSISTGQKGHFDSLHHK
jgi:hypothetical protein